MNYKALKFLSILTAILFVLSCSCAALGFITHQNNKPDDTPTPDDNGTIVNKHIIYKYYLEGVEVEEMPTNPKKEESNETNETNETEEDILYKFDEYKCTNGVTGEFDTDTWTFLPSKDIDSTCTLYFNKAKYNVTLTVIKGKPDDSNVYLVERFKDGEFKIIPDDGYQYSESQCSNDKVVSYDTSKNILKISAIASDVACKLTFVQKQLDFELTIKNSSGCAECNNGKIQTKIYYGEEATYLISPKDGFEFSKDKLKCTNNQEPKYDRGNFSITPTNNTKCTLEFVKSNVKKYKISITNSEDENIKSKFSITQGSDVITVDEGGTGTIEIGTINPEENPNLLPKLECPAQLPDIAEKGNSRLFTWIGVSKDINCQIKEEIKQATTN